MRPEPTEVLLRDGRRVIVRGVRPQDAAALRAAVEGLSPASRYNRFMGAVSTIAPALLQSAVSPAAEREYALVAVPAEADDSTIVGGARYVVEPSGSTCEFAVAVADAWQHGGLATHLVTTLIRAARLQGLTAMRGYVLASNERMLDFARRRGSEVTASEEGPTVRLVTLRLTD
jgi:acetyltransferase